MCNDATQRPFCACARMFPTVVPWLHSVYSPADKTSGRWAEFTLKQSPEGKSRPLFVIISSLLIIRPDLKEMRTLSRVARDKSGIPSDVNGTLLFTAKQNVELRCSCLRRASRHDATPAVCSLCAAQLEFRSLVETCSIFRAAPGAESEREMAAVELQRLRVAAGARAGLRSLRPAAAALHPGRTRLKLSSSLHGTAGKHLLLLHCINIYTFIYI